MQLTTIYPTPQGTEELRKFLNIGRTATQGSQGVVGFKFIEPARVDGDRDRVTSYSRKLGLIQPIIGEIQPRAQVANAFITPALFRSGSTSFEQKDVIGHWAIVLDEDADKGERVILPPIQPTFIIQTSVTGEAKNHQYWWVFGRILSPQEDEKIRDLIHRKCGGDVACIKNPAQFYRLPGTLNHPFLAKLKRGRSSIPQPARIVGGTCDVH
jgi:hypothetical protein